MNVKLISYSQPSLYAFTTNDKEEAPKKFPITEHLNMDCEDTYVNHSARNNLDLKGQILFVANRDIKAGEELTMDYTQFTSGKYLF